MIASPDFLGIDLGTSKSSMAWFNRRTGHAEVIRNAEGEEKTPTVVYFGQDEVLVGSPAEQMLDDEEGRRRVLLGFKRDLGRGLKVAVGHTVVSGGIPLVTGGAADGISRGGPETGGVTPLADTRPATDFVDTFTMDIWTIDGQSR